MVMHAILRDVGKTAFYQLHRRRVTQKLALQGACNKRLPPSDQSGEVASWAVMDAAGASLDTSCVVVGQTSEVSMQ